MTAIESHHALASSINVISHGAHGTKTSLTSTGCVQPNPLLDYDGSGPPLHSHVDFQGDPEYPHNVHGDARGFPVMTEATGSLRPSVSVSQVWPVGVVRVSTNFH